jgi:hypothetical protein
MIVAILVAIYLCVLFLDFRPLLKQCKSGFKVLYIAMLAVSLSVLMLFELGVDIPSPTMPIERVISALFGVS